LSLLRGLGRELQQAKLQTVVDELERVTHATLEGLQVLGALHVAGLVDVAAVLLGKDPFID
jgi:hypothetical protein